MIVEFGGTKSSGGTTGQAGALSSNGGSLDVFAGSAGDTSLAGTRAAIAGDASNGGMNGTAGSSGIAGTPISFSGTPSMGGS